MKNRCKAGPVLVICGCLALFLITSGCTQSAPPDTRVADEKTIRDLDAEWSKASVAKNLDAVMSYYSEDAYVLPQNSPMLKDKQAIRALWASMLVPGLDISWEVTKIEVSRSADLAYIVAAYHESGKDAQGNPASDKGKIIEVWKKQADGSWKVVADIFNTDLPPATPVEKKK